MAICFGHNLGQFWKINKRGGGGGRVQIRSGGGVFKFTEKNKRDPPAYSAPQSKRSIKNDRKNCGILNTINSIYLNLARGNPDTLF